MVDENKLDKEASPWHPMQDPIDLKHLGKLGEEAGELVSAVTRCIIQGINEAEPVTGRLNRMWLEDEIADVYANIKLNIDRFNLDTSRIRTRMNKKIQYLQNWHDKA